MNWQYYLPSNSHQAGHTAQQHQQAHVLMTSRMPPSGRRPMSWRPTPLPRLRMLRAGVKPSKSSSHPPCRASSRPHAPNSHRPTFSQGHGRQWETRQRPNSGHAATGRLFLVTVHGWLFAGYPDWTCPMHRFVSGYAGANRPIASGRRHQQWALFLQWQPWSICLL